MTAGPAPSQEWTPTSGPALEGMLQRSGLDDDAVAVTRSETLRVLGRCGRPEWDSRRAEAELVVGAVQSGKTMSFTALIAAARDNGFPLVVVLAGTKKNLRDQTYERLLRDLGMQGDGGLPAWSPINGPDLSDADEVARRLDRWAREPRPAHVVTTVAVVLKNHASLRRAQAFLAAIAAKSGGVPALFVDDEADQAGLNIAARRGDESSTYRAIRLVREAAPNHTYVLYTATPQAPLLISLTDALSPRSVTVLRPGVDYVGGEDLFVDRRSEFVRFIDDDGALDAQGIRPPESLERALATFLLAMLVAQRREAPRPLSMLIHPSSGKDLHASYADWTRALLSRVDTALLDGDPVLRHQLRTEMFVEPYADLSSTGGTVVDGTVVELDDLLTDLEAYLPEIAVRVVNSEDGHEINPGEWGQHPGWVVIGGNKLDRGSTVENLAITYMPRGPGMRNADTVQQRGRFFGYKARYLDLLRAWLNPETLAVYTSYVDHEIAMRRDLGELDVSGTPLREWRRSILLDPTLNPTRRQVITLENESHALRPGWVLAQTHVYGDAVGPTPVAEIALQDLLDEAEPDERDKRSDFSIRNRIVRLTWDRLGPVLADWRGAAPEQDRVYALLLALREHDPATIPCDLVQMNSGRPRSRGLHPQSEAALAAVGYQLDMFDDPETLEIANLMQGPDPDNGSVYPGDRGFRSSDAITVQVHRLVTAVGPSRREVTALAVHLPADVRQRVILQT